MSSFVFPCFVVYQVLENRLALVEMLNYPEVSRLGANRDRLRAHLRRNLRRLLEPAPLSTLFHQHVASRPVVTNMSLLLDPAPGSFAWREALPLTFSVIRWRQGEVELAFVPALGIAVLAARAEELEARLTLAEFWFGSRQRLTRFDMSEFGDPVAVQRLVGGVFGSEGHLTAKVREQPFSVLGPPRDDSKGNHKMPLA